jgi:hypothetical protein
MTPSSRLRPSLPFAALVAAFFFVGCSASHDTGAEGEGTSASGKGALLRCPAGQVRECSNETPNGSLICWCEDNSPPALPPLTNSAGDWCRSDTTNPYPAPALPGCQRGLWVNQAEFFLCPVGTPIPAHVYDTSSTAQVSEWVMTNDTWRSPGCDSTTGGPAGEICYFSPDQFSTGCAPYPPDGWVYMVESDHGGGPITGGCKGGCGMLCTGCEP